MLIAVGDQRRERVHMVRVLYHWNFIRLRERIKKKRERERGNKNVSVVISELYVLRLLPHNYSLVCRLLERGSMELWVFSRCQTTKPQ